MIGIVGRSDAAHPTVIILQCLKAYPKAKDVETQSMLLEAIERLWYIGRWKDLKEAASGDYYHASRAQVSGLFREELEKLYDAHDVNIRLTKDKWIELQVKEK